MKKYMVIETIAPDHLHDVYKRFHSQGRMLPKGLYYLNSWLEVGGHRCFQLMETEDRSLFETWSEQWSDLVSFEIVEIGEKPAS